MSALRPSPPSAARSPRSTLAENRRPAMVEPTALTPASKQKRLARAPSDPLVSPGKQTKSAGVTPRGGRIYDPENGKTCHQCRQKTLAFAASCKNDGGGKRCPIRYCYTCLLNRYGESAEAAAAADAWSCPKCRGICNCSFCMRKRGQKPTGILAPIARSSGFSSVSEMLQRWGSSGWEAKTAAVAGSSAEYPVDVDELLEVEMRREEERDREIAALKEEIAALQAEMEEAGKESRA